MTGLKEQAWLKRSKCLPFVELRTASQSAACYHAHSHDEFSFGVIDEGSAKYINMGKEHEIKKGATVTINPNDVHSCNPDQGLWSYRMIFVNSQWLNQLQSEMFEKNAEGFLRFSQDFHNDKESFKLFDKLYAALLEDDNPLECESLLIECLAKQFKGNAFIEQSKETPLDNAYKILNERLCENISLEELATCCQLSRFHFIRLFKQKYGLSPHALQLDKRIIKAREMLQLGNSISETAFNLGFSDQAHFQRHFKKRVAMTPKKYQQNFL